MSLFTEQDQAGLRALTQELEDGKRVKSSISREFASAYTNSTHTNNGAQPDIASRLATALDLHPAASQLGPWDTGYIAFSDGVAVGANAHLVLYPNGAYNFSGQAHVSGAISYGFAFAWAVMDSQGNIYRFATQGRLHGTFESGSRDYDWGKSEIIPALAQGWGALQSGWHWHWNARVNADWGAFLDDINKAVAAGKGIAAVISIFV